MCIRDRCVVTLAIRKTRNARTSIRVHGNEWIRVCGRLCACTSVLTWTAVALVHIDVAVATERRVIVTLADGALRRILGDEVIQTYAVGEPSGTRASVRMAGNGSECRRIVAHSSVLTRAARALVNVHVTVACIDAAC